MPRYQVVSFDIYTNPARNDDPPSQSVSVVLRDRDRNLVTRHLHKDNKVLLDFIAHLSHRLGTDTTFITIDGNAHDALVSVSIRNHAELGLPHFVK